jgi:hypothetical protein
VAIPEYTEGLKDFYVTGDFIEPHAMPHNTINPLTGSQDFCGRERRIMLRLNFGGRVDP